MEEEGAELAYPNLLSCLAPSKNELLAPDPVPVALGSEYVTLERSGPLEKAVLAR